METVKFFHLITNINLLGVRETAIYGKESFSSVNEQIAKAAQELNIKCACRVRIKACRKVVGCNSFYMDVSFYER